MERLKPTRLRVTLLGSMQKDHSVMAKIGQGHYDIILTAPNSLFDTPVCPTLGVQNKIGLIAIDEAHLIQTWRNFRYRVCGQVT